MLTWARNLRDYVFVGLNERNAQYIQRFNSRHLYPLVDDKLRTKQLAVAAGIAVPDLFGVMASQHDVRKLTEIVAGRHDFVVKPAHGTGGDGILVVSGRSARNNNVFRLADGNVVSEADVRHHVSNIISGQYSLGGIRDRALIEYCVKTDPFFDSVSFQGVPDVRVLVFMGYPIMSMVRLPTRRSRGKANLHQGAVGAGVDIVTGKTLSGVLGNEIVYEHPDTGEPIGDLYIPQWEHFLKLAARSYELTGLGYLGVDIVLDRVHGPLILELNARQGLNIQIANKAGLRKRLNRIDALTDNLSVDQKVALVQDLFAANL